MSDDSHDEIDSSAETDEKTENIEEPDEEDSLARWLEDLSPGCALVIRRLEPGYAKGWLEEIPITGNDNPVDLETIRNRWGGHKLSLRLRKRGGTLGPAHIIEMYSFDPLRYGKPIKNQNNPWLQKNDEEPVQTQQIVPAPPQNNPDIIGQIIGSQQTLLMHLMQQGSTKHEKEPAFQSLGDALKIVQAIQGMSTQQQGVPPAMAGGELGGLGALAPLLTALLSKNDKPKLVPQQQKSVSPSQEQFANQIMSLASKGPESAAAVCAQIFASIPNDQRETAIDSFLKTANIDIDYQDDENNEDNEDTD